MNAVLIIGRVLFALICLNAGVNHITHRKAMVGYAQFKKVPAAALAVPQVAVQDSAQGKFVYVAERDKDGKDIAGMRPVTLGDRVLRCEIAALAALAILRHELSAPDPA